MAKRDKDEHSKEKNKKKSKAKMGKSKLDGSSFSKEEIGQDLQDINDIINSEQTGDDTVSSINQSKDSITNDDENVDVEVEEEVLDAITEITTNVEELISERMKMKTEKPSCSKKGTKKPDNIEVKAAPPTPSSSSNPSKKNRRRRDSGTSSEEERWLTAVESGKLEEIEDVELRKIKDPKLMTARQRAMYDRNNDTESAPGFSETLVALPTGYKEKEKPQTAEELQKAALKILKRKQQADEKREKDKKKTMERLLKKQESKQRASNKPKATKEATAMITYRNTIEGGVIHLPPGMEFPLKAQLPREPPKPKLCGIPGCNNPKVYNCSKTNLPLCSYACYRKNVQSLKDIMC